MYYAAAPDLPQRSREDRGRPAIIGVSRDELALEIPRGQAPLWWQFGFMRRQTDDEVLVAALGQGGLDMSELNAYRGRLRGVSGEASPCWIGGLIRRSVDKRRNQVSGSAVAVRG